MWILAPFQLKRLKLHCAKIHRNSFNVTVGKRKMTPNVRTIFQLGTAELLRPSIDFLGQQFYSEGALTISRSRWIRRLKVEMNASVSMCDEFSLGDAIVSHLAELHRVRVDRVGVSRLPADQGSLWTATTLPLLDGRRRRHWWKDQI